MHIRRRGVAGARIACSHCVDTSVLYVYIDLPCRPEHPETTTSICAMMPLAHVNM
jgi:hypothetical protein